MKKLALFAVVLSGLALTSCSREKECHCEYDTAGIKSSQDVTISDGKCEDLDSSTTVGLSTVTVKCEKE
jgi:hypothetical protein